MVSGVRDNVLNVGHVMWLENETVGSSSSLVTLDGNRSDNHTQH